ncbi:MAG: helix-turn-helix domain-containing protein [Flavobacteriaceae bacterium]|nr:helix-turn-helix domain-containing protein [Flavobacteriaceae bacterium]
MERKIKFYKTRDQTLRKYMEGYYFISRKDHNSPMHFISFPGNYFIATICQNVDVTFGKDQISIHASSTENIVADFYHKKVNPVKITYARAFNEITIYFKPLGVLHFLEDLEDIELLCTTKIIPFPQYLDQMSKVLHMEAHSDKIQALETYWLSLLKSKNLGMVESILKDIELGLKITDIADRQGISRQYLHKLFFKYTGRSPSQYRKIDRFKKMVLQYKKNQNLSHLAYDHLYYDQAHFNKHFKALTHAQPGQFFRNATIMDSLLWMYGH